MGIRGMLERLRVRRAFREYIDEETIAKLLANPQAVQPQTKHFQFILILADETNPEEIPAIISKVIDTILEHRATLTDITSSLLVALLGVPFPEGNSPEGRRGLVDALLREYGDRIKVVHGECDGAVGLMGSQKRFSYGAVIPRFSEALSTLIETKLGTAVEISPYRSGALQPH